MPGAVDGDFGKRAAAELRVHFQRVAGLVAGERPLHPPEVAVVGPVAVGEVVREQAVDEEGAGIELRRGLAGTKAGARELDEDGGETARGDAVGFHRGGQVEGVGHAGAGVEIRGAADDGETLGVVLHDAHPGDRVGIDVGRGVGEQDGAAFENVPAVVGGVRAAAQPGVGRGEAGDIQGAGGGGKGEDRENRQGMADGDQDVAGFTGAGATGIARGAWFGLGLARCWSDATDAAV